MHFDDYISPDLASSSPFKLALVYPTLLFFNVFFLGQQNSPGLWDFCCLDLGIGHFSREPWFLWSGDSHLKTSQNAQCAHCYWGGFASRPLQWEELWKYIFFIFISTYLSVFFSSLNWEVPPENVKTGSKPLLVTLLLTLLELKYINLRNIELIRNRPGVGPFHITNFHGNS